jgi:hypothetical protein
VLRFLPALAGLAAATLVAGVAGVPAAEELRPALNAPLILHLLSRPVDGPEVAFRESLREAPAAPAREGGWETLPDGSARYSVGNVQVILRNPCPEGSFHPKKPLPGRRR